MDDATLNALLTQYLREMRARLDQISGIARAAEACAEAGNTPKAIEIALDIEQPIYEVTTFLNAANLMNRIGRQE
jgi:hypothetical protein